MQLKHKGFLVINRQIATLTIGLSVLAGGIAPQMNAAEANTAQSVKRNLLGSYRNWDAFVETDPKNGKACYMMSVPTKSTASRANVNRGDIYMTVTHRVKFAVKNEVNVVFGYPMKDGTEATLSIDGGSTMSFFTQRGNDGNSLGWAFDTKDDNMMVARMKRGNNLVAKGSSARGTRTTDTYSLSGFTAAYNAITRECG